MNKRRIYTNMEPVISEAPITNHKRYFIAAIVFAAIGLVLLIIAYCNWNVIGQLVQSTQNSSSSSSSSESAAGQAVGGVAAAFALGIVGALLLFFVNIIPCAAVARVPMIFTIIGWVNFRKSVGTDRKKVLIMSIIHSVFLALAAARLIILFAASV